MNLAIVDIDGTLTKTTDIDAECYVRVVSAFLGHSFPADWSAYVNVTDSGIVDELWRETFGRSPTAAEMASVESASQSWNKPRGNGLVRSRRSRARLNFWSDLAPPAGRWPSQLEHGIDLQN